MIGKFLCLGASSYRSDSVEFDESDMEFRRHTSSTMSRTTTIDNDDDIGYHRSNRTHQSKIETKSFLNSSTKVTGVQDVLDRMKNADNGTAILQFYKRFIIDNGGFFFC